MEFPFHSVISGHALGVSAVSEITRYAQRTHRRHYAYLLHTVQTVGPITNTMCVFPGKRLNDDIP